MFHEKMNDLPVTVTLMDVVCNHGRHHYFLIHSEHTPVFNAMTPTLLLICPVFLKH
jgi:hypothetical protein